MHIRKKYIPDDKLCERDPAKISLNNYLYTLPASIAPEEYAGTADVRELLP
jgi:hypothetical protein